MDHARILNLVDEAIESGRKADEVCADCPELLSEVRRLLREYQHVERELDAYLPSSNAASLEESDEDDALPAIAGYELLATLGTGGMGVVFLGRHLKLGRRVAIKMLLAGPYASHEERERFMREARALATLRHPNIVSVYDVGEHQGRPYFTMEHMEGGTLADKLAGSPQQSREAVQAVLTLADAVEHAHRHGIVHRDLKPANILIAGDGTLKISDFGIARSSRAEQTLTLAGARMGTPNYMAPEQAVGDAAAGPGVDVYALGAILYECLTGRPPFRGATAAETQRQLLHEDAAPPRLVNASVPRDVETICLKTLQKRPEKRYASAEALAEDLRRFLKGQPIAARPVGVVERGAKWARRRPGAAVAVVAAAVLVLASAAATTWTISSRRAAFTAVTADLEEAVDHQRSGAWAQSQAAIERARARLGSLENTGLHQWLTRAQSDLDLVHRLDNIRMFHARTVDGALNDAAAAKEYELVFRESGHYSADNAPDFAAKRIEASPIAKELVGALDDWSTCLKDEPRKAWVVQTALLADRDEDPRQWRRRAREASVDGTREALAGLAEEAVPSRQPAPFLYAFSRTLDGVGIDSLPFFRQAQRSHPNDFWLTSQYANVLNNRGKFADAIEYYRAAAALRPDTMVTHYNLGRALGSARRLAEAEESLREAVRLDPRASDATNALGLVLYDRGKDAEALAVLLRGYELDPVDASLMALIGACQVKLGRAGEAVAWYQRAVAANPEQARDKWGVRANLLARGEQEAAFAVWKCSLAARPGDVSDWDGYAELCLYLGEVAEYERARTVLLDRFANVKDPSWCERIARACLLSPTLSAADHERVLILIERALASQVEKRTYLYPYFLLARGLADYREGKLDNALVIAGGESSAILKPLPLLLAAVAAEKLGQHDMAVKHLAQASLAMNWTKRGAPAREEWMCHVLRREAEQAVFPGIAELLTSTSLPEDDGARRALLAACQASERFGRWAQLWEASTAADPSGVDTPSHVLCTLVLAASGAGVDAGQYTDGDRDRWRHHALTRLRDQLEAWKRNERNSTDPKVVAGAKKAIADWLLIPELSSVREPEQLVRLPESQRKEWEALWRNARGEAATTQKPK